MSTLVTVAVVNWNGEKFIHRCLEHAFAQTHKPLEVIVVDNGSTDGSLEKIKSRYGDRCRYIENGSNIGYSPGMNQAMSAGRGEFLVQLNSDACLHEAFIERAVARIQQDDRIGAIGGRVYQWAGDQLTDTLRRSEGGPYYFRKQMQLRSNERIEHEMLSFGPASCFPLLRMAMLKDVHEATGYYFDESFVTGWEDTDLWFRMQLRGWTCWYVPTAYGWHVGSGSTNGTDTFFAKNVAYRTRIVRNRLFVITKNLPLAVFLRLLPILVFVELAMVPYFAIRSPSSIRAFFAGWSQFLRQARLVWSKRQRVQRAVVVPTAYVQSFFEKI